MKRSRTEPAAVRHERLIARLETFARTHPRAYRRRVLGLAMLGWAYLYGLPCLLAAGMSASVAWLVQGGPTWLALPLAVILGVLLVLMLRMLWVRWPAPAGLELKADQAPKLFEMLEALRAQLDGPPIHRVLLTEDFNAAIVQIPRFGLWSGHRNALLIGLPLMLALSRHELLAVLAHEVGHLAGGHGKFLTWIYLQRMRWERLAASLPRRWVWSAVLAAPFVRRFTPYFNAYSFVLARANEYLADRAAVQAAGAPATVRAITTVAVLAPFWSRQYWREVWRGAQHAPQPAAHPYAGWRDAAVRESRRPSCRTALVRALDQRTGHADTHPALAERIAAIGGKPAWAPIHHPSAADAIFGERLPDYVGHHDIQWRVNVRPAWAQRHQAIQAALAELAELDRREAAGPFSVDDRFRRAELVDQYDLADDLAALYRDVLDADPEHVESLYRLAYLLCERGEDEGLACADRLIRLGRGRVAEARELAAAHARDGGPRQPAERTE